MTTRRTRTLTLTTGALAATTLLGACGSSSSDSPKTVTVSAPAPTSTAASTAAPSTPSASTTQGRKIDPNSFVTHGNGQVDGFPTASGRVTADSRSTAPSLIPGGIIHRVDCGTRVDYLTLTDVAGSRSCYASGGTASAGINVTRVSTGNNAGTLFFSDGTRVQFQPWTVLDVDQTKTTMVTTVQING